MLGRFGVSLFGLSEFIRRLFPGGAKLVAVIGDTSTHGGSIITSGQDGFFLIGGLQVAVEGPTSLDGATLSCPLHGNTIISSVIHKTYYNGKLLITTDAVAGCGAKIVATNRGVYAG